MKHILLAALIAAPGLASASLGPSIAQSEASVVQSHLVGLAWSQPGQAPTSECATPAPVVDTTLYACAVFPATD